MDEQGLIALFYDFETTGLPDWSQPSEAPQQPHIVEVGAQLVELATNKVIQTLDVIVRPQGWIIPDEVAELHGITTERALDVGIPEELAVEMLFEMWRPSRPLLRIGHNEPFDARIMRIGLMRYFSEELADLWKAGRAECTQKIATPIMKLPPTEKMLAVGRKHSKSANLGEAYEFITGQPLAGAHNALVDVEAARTVYFGFRAMLRPGIGQEVAA